MNVRPTVEIISLCSSDEEEAAILNDEANGSNSTDEAIASGSGLSGGNNNSKNDTNYGNSFGKILEIIKSSSSRTIPL